MDVALAEARAAALHDDVPIGAVVVQTSDSGDARILTRRHNERELSGDGTAHAEVLALRDACAELGRWRLDDCLMVVTLEPCPMCAGAIVLARIPRVIYAAPDPKAGAAGSIVDLLRHPRLNHRVDVQGGLLADEAAAQLRAFFQRLRDEGQG